MKKLSFILAAALFCGISFTSCSEDDTIANSSVASNDSSESIASPYMIEFDAPFLSTMTRTLVDADNFTGQEAMVYVVRQDLSTGNMVLQATPVLSYNKTTSEWETDIDTPWYVDYQYKFQAVMPSDLSVTWGNYCQITSLPIAAVADNDATDVLEAQTTTTYAASAGQPVTLDFKHIYNLLSVEFAEPTTSQGYKIKVNSASLWLPSTTGTWSGSSGSSYSDSFYTELATGAVESASYAEYDLGSGTSGSMDASEFLLLISKKNGIYAYVDMDYEVTDANNITIEKYTVEKQAILFDASMMTDNYGKNITLKFNFDADSKVNNMSFVAVYNARDDVDDAVEEDI